MPLNDPRAALVAAHRFGYGPRPGDLAAPGDPRAALHAEIAHGDSVLVMQDEVWANGLGGTAADMQATYLASETRRAMRAAETALAQAAADPAGRSEIVADTEPTRIAALKASATADGPIYRNEALVRLRRAAIAPIGYLERLVAFWSNHFCISGAKGEFARATAGAFEREAIRPHVLGRFSDMLMAVEQHPAMLTYLDNVQSVGPDARGNRNGKRGLNENLARETLELHTLGVGSGYNQTDVTTFARVLTGWTVAGRDGRGGEPGTFTFNAGLHEPGDETVLGHTYPAGGFGQGEAVLTDLAASPATARHVATKLVRHFVADDPPADAVDGIVKVFTRTDGDLRAVSLALVDLPAAWAAPLTKLRSPYDFLLGAIRLLDRPPTEPGSLITSLRQLGMPLWEPPGPNGFPDVSAAWLAPEALKLRLEISAQLAHGFGGDRTAPAVLADAFGDACSAETREAVGRAESREQAVAMILMAPEFQRR